MHKYYMDNSVSLVDAGKHFGISASALRKRFVKNNLSTKTRNATRQVDLNCRVLKSLYCDNWSIDELAKHFNCATGTIWNRLISLGINRKSEESKSLREENYTLWTNEIEIEVKKILRSTGSLIKTAKITGLPVGTIEFKNKSWGIQIGFWNNNTASRGKKLLEEHMDYDKVAKILGITQNSLISKNHRSWKVDLSSNSTLLGIPTVANDGSKYRSKFEASIVNFLVSKDILFEYEKRVCKNKLWTCDFVIGDIWIEADGLCEWRTKLGQKSYSGEHEKIKYYKDHNFNYVILKRSGWKKKLISLLGV